MSVNPTGTLVQRIGERFKTALQESSDFRGDLSVVIDYHAEVASEVRALLQRRFEALADPLHERTRGVHTHLARLNAGATTQPSGGPPDQPFTADPPLHLDDGVQRRGSGGATGLERLRAELQLPHSSAPLRQA